MAYTSALSDVWVLKPTQGPFYGPLGWGDLPSLNCLFPVQLHPTSLHSHHYLYTPSFLVLFIFLGPFSTVRSWQNLSLISIFIKFTSASSENEGSRQGTGWRPKKAKKRKKTFPLKNKKRALLSPNFISVHISLWCFCFFTQRKPTVVPGSSQSSAEARDTEGSVLTVRQELCCPSPALYCL